jgi:hypothetical protein
MPNSNTEHSKKLRAKTATQHNKNKILLGYRCVQIMIPPSNLKKWDSLENKSEFVNNAIAKIFIF